MDNVIAITSLFLAAAILLIPLFGLYHRNKVDKGIGWQFIRFSVITMSLPTCALLALNGALSEGAVAIIAGALGYAFGKAEDGPKSKKD